MLISPSSLQAQASASVKLSPASSKYMGRYSNISSLLHIGMLSLRSCISMLVPIFLQAQASANHTLLLARNKYLGRSQIVFIVRTEVL